MVQVHAIPAFSNNYLWLMVAEGEPATVVVVDPGDALPVIETLRRLGLEPAALFITHHHNDHVGGIAALRGRYPLIDVYGPAGEPISHLTHVVRQGDQITLRGLPTFMVMEVPGHTAGHIAYAGGGLLFCGDTLFAGGCGRVSGGTAAQLYTSLMAIASLPDDTFVYCAHEYTLSNLRFAMEVEPDNDALRARYDTALALRRDNAATVPSRLALEKATNPFLRCHTPAVVAAVSRHARRARRPGVETFVTLRGWKDNWNG